LSTGVGGRCIEQGGAVAGAGRPDGRPFPPAVVARPLWRLDQGQASPGAWDAATPPSPPSPIFKAQDQRIAPPSQFGGNFSQHFVVKPIVRLGVRPRASTVGACFSEPLASELLAEQPALSNNDADRALEKERLRGKLLELGSTFSELDRRVEEDAKQRRELEEQRLRDTMERLARLKAGIESEAGRREKANADLESRVDKLLGQMVSRVGKVLEDRTARLSRSVEDLCKRCSTVERGILQFRGDVPSKLRVDAAALKHDIRALAAEVQDDRKRRADEDARLWKDLEDFERRADAGMQQEVTQLERQREVLQEFIDEFASAERSRDLQRSRAFVQDSVEALERELAGEVAAREKADDQVVLAINEYAAWLHRSLMLTSA